MGTSISCHLPVECFLSRFSGPPGSVHDGSKRERRPGLRRPRAQVGWPGLGTPDPTPSPVSLPAPWQADAVQTEDTGACKHQRAPGTRRRLCRHGLIRSHRAPTAQPGLLRPPALVQSQGLWHSHPSAEPDGVGYSINSFFVHRRTTQGGVKLALNGARERHGLKPVAGAGAPFRSPWPRGSAAPARSAAAANSDKALARSRGWSGQPCDPHVCLPRAPGRPAGRRASGSPAPAHWGGRRHTCKNSQSGTNRGAAPGGTSGTPRGQGERAEGERPLLILGAAQSERGYLTPCRAP